MSSRAVTIKTGSVQEVLPPSRTSHSKKLRQFLLIPFSLLFALCLIELPAALSLVNYSRLVGPGAMDVFLATNKSDPELLHIHPPHSHFSGQARGGNIAANFKLPAAATTLYRWVVINYQNGFRNGVGLNSA